MQITAKLWGEGPGKSSPNTPSTGMETRRVFLWSEERFYPVGKRHHKAFYKVAKLHCASVKAEPICLTSQHAEAGWIKRLSHAVAGEDIVIHFVPLPPRELFAKQIAIVVG